MLPHRSADPSAGPRGRAARSGLFASHSLSALRWGLLVLNGVAVVLCVALLRQQLMADEALSRLQSRNTAALLARGTSALMDKARLAIDSVADALEADLRATGLKPATNWPAVDRAVLRVPELQTVGLFDASGAQICGEPAERCRNLNVADRDYFVRYRDDAAASPGLYGPIDSRFDGQPALVLARALRDADGRFAGVAIGLLPVKRLEALVSQASLGPGTVASLRLASTLKLLVRVPPLSGQQEGAHLTALLSEAEAVMQRQPESGSFTATSSVDGATRINAYEHVGGYPVYAMVGDSQVDSQATWRTLLAWTCGSLLVFGGLSLAIERVATLGYRSGQRAQQLFDEAPCGYHTLDDQGHFVEINATELSWLGRQREDIVGKVRAADLLTAEGRKTLLTHFPKLLAGETVRGLEYDLVVDGQPTRRVSVDAAPVLDQAGRFVSSNTIMTDITALHQARLALQDQFARQQVLLDNQLVGIARVKDRQFVWVNTAFERLFGYGRDILAGQDTEVLYPNRAAFEATGAAVAASISQTGSYRATLELRHRDGRAIWVDCSGAVSEAASGELIWFSKDVTEARRSEALRIETVRLAAENRQLLETTRLHSMFLANMSHELRTPLNAVIGFADLLQLPSVVGDGDKRSRYLGQIGASAKHLLSMIETLLELAKLEAGKVQMRPVAVDPCAVVQEVVDMLEAKAQAANVVVAREGPVLPLVNLDPLRLKQVLLNYVDNAIKFSKGGGRVVVSALIPHPGRLRIEVADEGIGIAESDQPRLFVRFQQLSVGTTKAYEGTGIGLALVKQIVEAQGGRVGVRSKVGRGSVFWAEWPEAS